MLFSILFRSIISKRFDNLIFVEKMYNSDEVIFMLSAISRHYKKQMNAQVIELSSFKSCIRDFLSEENIKIRLFPLTVLFLCPIFYSRCFFNVIKSSNPKFLEDCSFLNEDFQDAIAIKCGVNWRVKRWLPSVVLRVTIELCYFIFFIKVIDMIKFKAKLVITGDNSYRYGGLAKYASFSGIPVITNLNMNELKLNHYTDFSQFGIDPSSVEEGDFKIDLTDEQIEKQVNDYFSSRFSGEIMQHDVIAAHAKGSDPFNPFPNKKPIATIFSHVLCDAPSNIPGKLHKDYKEWFLDSLKILLDNKSVNVCVKEHPSASLYGEEGLIRKLCLDNDLDVSCVQFVDNVQNSKILDVSKYVITCNGTVGLEALQKEKQVIVASDAFYSLPDLVHTPKSQKVYREYLLNIGTDSFSDIFFSKELKNRVYSLLYYAFFTLNNRQKLRNFPLPPYVKGRINELAEADFLVLNDYLKENGVLNELDDLIEKKKLKFIL